MAASKSITVYWWGN